MSFNFPRPIRRRISNGRTSAINRPARINGYRSKLIYEVPHDYSEGEVLQRTPAEVEVLKNKTTHLSEITRITLTVMEITKLPSELVSIIFQFAGLHATFSTSTNNTMFGRSNMNYEYLRLSIPPLDALDLPPEVTISSKCSQLIVECSSHDQGWSSENHQYNGTYEDSYTWSEVAIMKNVPNDANSTDFLKEVDRAMISKNLRVDQSFRHHMKRFYESDGFIKNIDLGDEVVIFLRSQYPGWQNTANFASITVKFLVWINDVQVPT